MRKIVCSLFIIAIPIVVMAQASGGQIKRNTPKQNTVTSKKPTNHAGISVVNGHKAVDLGLSVRWATCNVGASKPEEYGNYYAWGETKPKTDYSWSTYFDIAKSGIKEGLYGPSWESFEKYNSYEEKRRKLLKEDDVATLKWGASWRTPLKKEFEELWALPHKWEVVNGISGMRFTSSNGNTIFLPAAGGKKDLEHVAKGMAIYWTSEIYLTDHDTSDSGFAWIIDENEGGVAYLNRYQGFSIRPVTDQ